METRHTPEESAAEIAADQATNAPAMESGDPNKADEARRLNTIYNALLSLLPEPPPPSAS